MRRLVERGVPELLMTGLTGDPDVPHAPASLGSLPGRPADAGLPTDLGHPGPQLVTERAAFRLVFENRYRHRMVMPAAAAGHAWAGRSSEDVSRVRRRTFPLRLRKGRRSPRGWPPGPPAPGPPLPRLLAAPGSPWRWHDDRLSRHRSHLVAELADLRVHVIRGPFPSVMHDVKHRDACGPRPGEQLYRLSQRVPRPRRAP
jgi:hypothetical protein